MQKHRKDWRLAPVILVPLLHSICAGGAQREIVGNTTTLFIQVRDDAGNPLRGSSRVRLQKEDGQLIEESNTDLEGRSQFNNIPRESLVVVVRREGYIPATQRLGLRQTLRQIFLSMTLTKSATLGEEVTGELRVGANDLSMPPKARHNYQKGLSEARKGNYERAAEYMEKATQLYPLSAVLWNDLGSSYLRRQKYDLAEGAFRKALETDKSAAPPLLNLGMLYNLQRRFGEAESLLVRFTERDARRWQGFFELGNAHLGLRQFARAENDYKRAMELNAGVPADIHVKLASVYVGKREFSMALKEYEIYLQQDPNGGLAPRVREVIQRMKADGVPANTP